MTRADAFHLAAELLTRPMDDSGDLIDQVQSQLDVTLLVSALVVLGKDLALSFEVGPEHLRELGLSYAVALDVEGRAKL